MLENDVLCVKSMFGVLKVCFVCEMYILCVKKKYVSCVKSMFRV